MGVVSSPGINEIEAAMDKLRSMWEIAVHCNNGTVPVVLSYHPYNQVGDKYRDVSFLNALQSALESLCNHTTTETAIKVEEGLCCSSAGIDGFEYVQEQVLTGNRHTPQANVLSQSDWWTDFESIVNWLYNNLYSTSDCPACFDDFSAFPATCLAVTGFEDLCSSGECIAETPDSEDPDYDNDYCEWTGLLKWSATDNWWEESCFSDTGLQYFNTLTTTTTPSSWTPASYYWGGTFADCDDRDKEVLVNSMCILVAIKMSDAGNGKKFELFFYRRCGGAVIWQGCSTSLTGTYTRTDGKSQSPATMSVASSEDCPDCAPGVCPCKGEENWDKLVNGEIEECGGLVAEYVIQNNLTSAYGGGSIIMGSYNYSDSGCSDLVFGDEFRVPPGSPMSVFATAVFPTADSCQWVSVDQMEYRGYGHWGPEWTEWEVVEYASFYGFISLADCKWRLGYVMDKPVGWRLGNVMDKPVGNTPVGEYAKEQVCEYDGTKELYSTCRRGATVTEAT